MQRVPKPINASPLTTSATAYYTVPSGTISTVANLSLTNTSASPVSVTVYNVPSAGSPGTSNVLVSAFSLAGGQSYVPPQAIGLQMAAGSTLQALAATGAVVILQGGVYETSGS
jgi:hypothetical protein